MSRKYRLATALDIDDLLMECTSYAIRLANEKYKFDPPMTIYEKSTWGRLNSRIDTIYEYFDDPEFYPTRLQGCSRVCAKTVSNDRRVYCHGRPP